ncbi:LysM domain protein [Mariprofundus micogutta]|uniref:LysM domain protein n=1 Tax=Mariprofundus micogutta TaxID=1921010 RepID=A0A1L8CQZ8_9PROT|nr:LysM peptidoglycan-binding domain-containing protein [Mariprofundus micogutta]GAV21333.1 LysM domain protein [Mariprofundus micogutta]
MKSNPLLLIALTLGLIMASAPVQADTLKMPPTITANDVKPNLPQPYIVKKDDTLWDIADYFFKDPWKWLKIWERNLYITNPDLIYPGNEIWFDGTRIKQGGLTTVSPRPQVVIKPVERIDGVVDSSIMLAALERQDFISADEIEGMGYVLDSRDERINYGVNDHIYLRLQQSAKQGDLFDVFRTADEVRDPNSGDVAGVLVEHLGQVRVDSNADGVYRGLVVKGFEEISRGDRLKPAKVIDPKIVPSTPDQKLSGNVMYIRNNAKEAGQNQVIGISLGITNGVKPGTALSIYKAGRVVEDKVTGEDVRLPLEKIGRLLVLVPQDRASIALVTSSTQAINIGDAILSYKP